MKQGWEYKKLGEVCEIYQPKTLSTDMLTKTGGYPVYGANGIIGYYNQYNHEEQEVLLTCRGATCGTVNISKPYSWINGNAMVIHRKSEEMDFNFLKYLMLSLDYSLIITGAAQPQITRQKLAPTKIKIPPKSTQLSIVSELDKINELIRLKQEQLKDYDNLAQSIFYEMFGDPVENEKGWEVKKIGEIGSVERGAGISKKDFVEDGLPCIHYGQLHTILGARTKKHYTSIPHDLLPKYKVAHTGDLVMAITSEDVEGSCKSTAWLGNYDVIVGSDAAILHHEQDGTFLSYYTMTKAFYNEKAKYAKGFKVTHISTKEIEKISVFLPPLPLQHLFAQRIEQIERQKSAVQKSITDLETLLASRMQYWFE